MTNKSRVFIETRYDVRFSNRKSLCCSEYEKALCEHFKTGEGLAEGVELPEVYDVESVALTRNLGGNAFMLLLRPPSSSFDNLQPVFTFTVVIAGTGVTNNAEARIEEFERLLPSRMRSDIIMTQSAGESYRLHIFGDDASTELLEVPMKSRPATESNAAVLAKRICMVAAFAALLAFLIAVAGGPAWFANLGWCMVSMFAAEVVNWIYARRSKDVHVDVSSVAEGVSDLGLGARGAEFVQGVQVEHAEESELVSSASSRRGSQLFAAGRKEAGSSVGEDEILCKGSA